jgi:hypothetical protein
MQLRRLLTLLPLRVQALQPRMIRAGLRQVEVRVQLSSLRK